MRKESNNQHYENMSIMLQMLKFAFEAESVAYVVCQHYGINTSDYSFGYVAGWSEGKEMTELKNSLGVIRDAAAEMIGAVDERLEVIMQGRGVAEKVEDKMEMKTEEAKKKQSVRKKFEKNKEKSIKDPIRKKSNFSRSKYRSI